MTRSISIRPFVAGVLLLSLIAGGSGSAAWASSTRGHAPKSGPLHLVSPGYLTVGSDTTYPPMESTVNGKFLGADIDLAGALARAMGLKGAKFVSNDFTTIIPAMISRHRFDVIMSSMSDTPLRRKTVAFVDYMRASESILVKTKSPIHANSYAGMCGYKVAVESATTEFDGLTAANKKCGKKINIVTFTHDTDAFNGFKSGHADAYTGDFPVVLLYAKNSHGTFRQAGTPFGAGGDYGIALPKNSQSLSQALKQALHKIRANGQYTRILKRWGVNAAGL